MFGIPRHIEQQEIASLRWQVEATTLWTLLSPRVEASIPQPFLSVHHIFYSCGLV